MILEEVTSVEVLEAMLEGELTCESKHEVTTCTVKAVGIVEDRLHIAGVGLTCCQAIVDNLHVVLAESPDAYCMYCAREGKGLQKIIDCWKVRLI